MSFETSMIREKMIIMEENASPDNAEAEVLRSNRIGLELGKELITVRGQNMHCTLRMAARVVQQHNQHGLLISGQNVFEGWDELWDQCLTKYEREYNDQNWISIFGNGRTLYTTEGSIYMEVLEKCDHVNKGNYDAAVEFAENALKEIGRPVKIDHDATIAVILSATKKEVKCGIIHRAGGMDTTFNFVTSGGSSEGERLTRSMFMGSSFLEGINLGFFIKDIQDRLKEGSLKHHSDEADKMNAAIKRRNSIVREADRFEEAFNVRYRPERPNFMKNV